MSVSTIPRPDRLFDGIPRSVQITAWILGLLACVSGMLNQVAEWSPELAYVQFLLLAFAPIPFVLRTQVNPRVKAPTERQKSQWVDWGLMLVVGVIAGAVAAGIGSTIGNLPPAYHDEYSYLFQARTFLAGRFWFPSATAQPELFDQMHVLNEGRMASRYYPGTGLWLAPFVALGHPYWGQWIASAVAAMLIYWVGFELAGRFTGFVASLVMAISPGIGLFSNLLLAHHPCLMALSAFLLGITRWRRTRSSADAWIAGCGLSFAMLCRPMTAAAFGFPFGMDAIRWLIWPRTESNQDSLESDATSLARKKMASLLGLGIPLLGGWGLMLCYNQAVTGDWRTSPYQLYTDTYTPRHVYGFYNVIRGEQRLGPRVIEYYDRWAVNLTPTVAIDNLLNRWLCSWLWIFDIVPLLICTVIILGSLHRWDRRWSLVGFAILSLHAFHIPYWYVGIMGWHYVFETAPLWALYVAAATTSLISGWLRSRNHWIVAWWFVFLTISIAGVYVIPVERSGSRNPKPSRFVVGMNSVIFPRRQHAEYRRWIEQHVNRRPALVLLEQVATEGSHLDLVVNDPGLDAQILLGRFRAGITDLAKVRRDFPNRHLYVACPERHTIRQIE